MPDIITLKALCEELKIDPREARERLRAAASDPTGLSFEEFAVALMAVPNDDTSPDADGRDWWLKMLAAVHHETDGSEEGLELVQDWSAQHPSYDPGETETVWQSFRRGEGATGATVLYEARRHGWGNDHAAALAMLSDEDEAPPVKYTLADIDAMLDADDDAPPPVELEWGTPIMKGNNPVINLNNTTLYLGRDVDSVLPGLAHNLMTHRDEWRDGGVTDAAISLAQISLERLGLQTVGESLVSRAAQAVARKRQYHPIRDYLRALKWDGKPRLDSWLVRHAGAEATPYTMAVGRKFLIQMMARVMQPGCKADHTHRL